MAANEIQSSTHTGTLAPSGEPVEACNICGGRLKTRFARVVDPDSEETFSISGCESCGAGHTLPLPGDLGSYYGSDYYGRRHGLAAALCDRRRVRFLESATPKRGSLLDVGCGEGTFLLAAQRAGWTVSGNEFNPEPARSKGLTVSTRFEGGPYDCITLWHSLEHMTNPLQVLTELRGLLKPGGVLIAAVPDAGGLQARFFGANWLHLDVPRHVVHYDSRSLDVLFQKAGLRVERRWNQEWEYDLFGWVQSALNCVFHPGDIFFRSLTGRPSRAGGAKVALNWILGTLLMGAFLPLAWGGTLIFSGKNEPETGARK